MSERKQKSGGGGKGKGGEKKKKKRGNQSAPRITSDSMPVAQSFKVKGSLATSGSARRLGAFPVTHRELVSDVNIWGADFKTGLSTYLVNPANALLFPWLARMASSFSAYRFRSLRFIYVPACATSTNGHIGMAFDPDPTQAASRPVGTKIDVLNFECSERGAPFCEMVLSVPRKFLTNIGPRLLVRSLLNEEPSATHDAGNLHFYAIGPTPQALVGELYVQYVIEFFEPQSGDPDATSVWFYSGSGVAKTSGNLLGILTKGTFQGGLVFSVLPQVSPDATAVVVPPGSYFFTFITTGTGYTASANLTVLGFGNATLDWYYISASAPTGIVVCGMFRVNAALGGISLSLVTATPASGQLQLARNSAFNYRP